MSAVAAEQATERLAVEVTLTVTHRVVVKLEGNSGQSMDDLKRRALDEFHRDPTKHSNYLRTDDAWRNQFNGRTNVSVGPERAELASVTTKPAN